VTAEDHRWLYCINCVSASLDALHQQEMNSSMAYREQINELMKQCLEKESEVNDARQQFIDFKKQVTTSAVSGRSGKAVQSKVLRY
jgi:hypothetical protein